MDAGIRNVLSPHCMKAVGQVQNLLVEHCLVAIISKCLGIKCTIIIPTNQTAAQGCGAQQSLVVEGRACSAAKFVLNHSYP